MILYNEVYVAFVYEHTSYLSCFNYTVNQMLMSIYLRCILCPWGFCLIYFHWHILIVCVWCNLIVQVFVKPYFTFPQRNAKNRLWDVKLFYFPMQFFILLLVLNNIKSKILIKYFINRTIYHFIYSDFTLCIIISNWFNRTIFLRMYSKRFF